MFFFNEKFPKFTSNITKLCRNLEILIWTNESQCFFDTDFDKHADEIYSDPKWPESPLFYLNITSKTFKHTAPKDHENCFILIPIATDLEDNEDIRNKYFEIVAKRLLSITGYDLKKHIVFKKSYCIKEFKSDYNSFGGNAYGLANTLTQTAFLRPNLKSKKVKTNKTLIIWYVLLKRWTPLGFYSFG